MKYIIKNSDLFLNGKLIREGSEIELNENQIKGIEDFLQPCHSESDLSVEESQPQLTKKNTKGNKK